MASDALNILSLPNEILNKIVKYCHLSRDHRLIIAVVCKRMRDILHYIDSSDDTDLYFKFFRYMNPSTEKITSDINSKGSLEIRALVAYDMNVYTKIPKYILNHMTKLVIHVSAECRCEEADKAFIVTMAIIRDKIFTMTQGRLNVSLGTIDLRRAYSTSTKLKVYEKYVKYIDKYKHVPIHTLDCTNGIFMQDFFTNIRVLRQVNGNRTYQDDPSEVQSVCTSIGLYYTRDYLESSILTIDRLSLSHMYPVLNEVILTYVTDIRSDEILINNYRNYWVCIKWLMNKKLRFSVKCMFELPLVITPKINDLIVKHTGDPDIHPIFVEYHNAYKLGLTSIGTRRKNCLMLTINANHSDLERV